MMNSKNSSRGRQADKNSNPREKKSSDRNRTSSRSDRSSSDRNSGSSERNRSSSDRSSDRNRTSSDRPVRKSSEKPRFATSSSDNKKQFRSDARKPAVEQVCKDDTAGIRLNKYISNSGICSRREADTYIEHGSVFINGKIITQMGYKVQPGDEVRFDGTLISIEKKRYILLNKPKNYITTMEDERGRKTVMELVDNATKERIYPVGRLDRNTTGLLLFTNDGELAKKLTHPKHNVRKLYHASLDKKLSISDLDKLRDDVVIEGKKVFIDAVSYVEGERKTEVGIEIHSGRNRIVRKIFENFGYAVSKLDRVIFAGMTKRNLPRGRWRELTEQEVNTLKML
ncbi:pseudouridine synthase [Tenacibaculum finnmarkense]|uniref:pseudouridine synthase n=1 Tax=Tenacibaculum finnmarkense TaxID=2781243 RepID=UPI001E52A7B9|nr:pseudouridine synthase [Tenacibaculum finnmarkense]MBE7659032.1 pseudouridine synthase [Tenacibaculum finnmarkense genomovar finnmarkense]MCD8426222.1 rRNA pseudouridine synthase [Tenacibaculum finnmarkense genomovar finnmarkense]MCG8814234.1 rRNA pseudouridine synthase [Tenacibaculum finnmarkense]MCG8819259.1 rRNA pseudouridine synthase [Tenacibaculum finnmarkense]